MSMRRIAASLGVSLATVSMALQNHSRIPEKTRKRVRTMARRLGYKPNAKVAELMGHIRSSRHTKVQACLGVISFYESAHPWRESLHLSRMHEGMHKRAEQLGYRLESFWLRAPRITPQRLRAVLDARGIEGLLCFGSPLIDEKFPAEFDHYAIVTQGWSIKAPLHRVVNHGYNNTWRVLEKVHQVGYRRPGVIISRHIDERGAHAGLSAYFGWCEHNFGNPMPLPVLRALRVEEKPILEWLERHRPDVVVLIQDYDVLPEFSDFFRLHGIRVPKDLGVAAVSQLLRGTNFSGMEENQFLMGEWAVEMVIARIMNQDLGIPDSPRVEMVESLWVEGRSLLPRVS